MVVSRRPPGCEHREVDAKGYLPGTGRRTRRQEWLGGGYAEGGASRDGASQPQRQPRLDPFEPPQETAITDVAQPSQLTTRNADHGWDAQRATQKRRDETRLASPECMQDVEGSTAVLGNEGTGRSLPQVRTPSAGRGTAPQCGDLRPEDS